MPSLSRPSSSATRIDRGPIRWWWIGLGALLHGLVTGGWGQLIRDERHLGVLLPGVVVSAVWLAGRRHGETPWLIGALIISGSVGWHWAGQVWWLAVALAVVGALIPLLVRMGYGLLRRLRRARSWTASAAELAVAGLIISVIGGLVLVPSHGLDAMLPAATAHFLGVMAVAPAVVAWKRRFRRLASQPLSASTVAEALIITAITLTLAAGLVTGLVDDEHHALVAFFSFPIVMWSCVRFGAHGGFAVTAALALASAGAERIQVMLVVVDRPMARVEDSQAYLLCLVLSSAFLTAIIADLQRAWRRAGRDRIDQLRLQRELLTTRDTFEQVFSDLPDAILVLHRPHGAVAELNTAFAQLTGLQRDQVLGRSILELDLWEGTGDDAALRRALVEGRSEVRLNVHLRTTIPPDRERERQAFSVDQLSETASTSRIIRPDFRDSEGSRIALSPPTHGGVVADLSLRSATIGGQPHLVVVLRGVAERLHLEDALRRALDDAERASRAKDEFLAQMSHELRTPMHGIIGMSELLKEEPIDGQAREMAVAIHTASRSLLGVINDILDLSRLAGGYLRLAPAPFRLDGLLQEVSTLLRQTAHAKGIDLRCLIDGAPGERIGDALRLRQILLNLAGNAVKFTDQGRVEIRVTPWADQRWRFAVSDTGPGIPEELHAQLFEPFFQVDGGATRRHEGTGLGLAISRKLVELMGGRLGVDSAPGRGATFWFEVVLPPAG